MKKTVWNSQSIVLFIKIGWQRAIWQNKRIKENCLKSWKNKTICCLKRTDVTSRQLTNESPVKGEQLLDSIVVRLFQVVAVVWGRIK